jgi:hypothetical protein
MRKIKCVSVVLERCVLTCLQSESPLLIACDRGHVGVVFVLLSAGASIEAKTQVRNDERELFICSGRKDSPSLCLWS